VEEVANRTGTLVPPGGDSVLMRKLDGVLGQLRYIRWYAGVARSPVRLDPLNDVCPYRPVMYLFVNIELSQLGVLGTTYGIDVVMLGFARLSGLPRASV
jgi:hypothetical protein